MRCAPSNYIETCYVDGREILSHISSEEINWLRNTWYTTPFDAYSTDSNNEQIISANHEIIFDDSCFRYYETRTTVAEGAPVFAWKALVSLKNALQISHKVRVCIAERDLLMIPNQEGLHCRNLIKICDLEAARNRYLLKTYNFSSPDRQNIFLHKYATGLPGLVLETPTRIER